MDIFVREIGLFDELWVNIKGKKSGSRAPHFDFTKAIVKSIDLVVNKSFGLIWWD